MRKKLIALLLAAVTTVSLLSGCGADSGVMDTANANAVAGGNSNLPVVTWKMGSTWGAGNSTSLWISASAKSSASSPEVALP